LKVTQKVPSGSVVRQKLTPNFRFSANLYDSSAGTPKVSTPTQMGNSRVLFSGGTKNVDVPVARNTFVSAGKNLLSKTFSRNVAVGVQDNIRLPKLKFFVPSLVSTGSVVTPVVSSRGVVKPVFSVKGAYRSVYEPSILGRSVVSSRVIPSGVTSFSPVVSLVSTPKITFTPTTTLTTEVVSFTPSPPSFTPNPSIPSFTPSITSSPFYFPSGLGGFGGGGKGDFLSAVSFNPKYVGSVEAGVRGIYGKKPSRLSVSSGLNLRPLLRVRSFKGGI
jgi:hypothetical protein